MASIAAREVAKEVIREVRKGKIPNLQKIQRKHGYSKESAKSMKATRTIAYKNETKLVVEAMERERNRIISELSSKDLSKEKYRDLIDGLDKITKNVQLLSGKATDNVKVIPISNEFVQNSNQHQENSESEEED